LRNRIVHEGGTCSRYEAELIYNYLRNFLASLGLADLNTNINIKKHEGSDSPKLKSKGQTKVFKYLHERGLIINPSDNSRNISFKVETLNLIFDAIYNEVQNIADSNTAQKVLRKAGYVSGSNFGSMMDKKWELEYEEVSINNKISLWCDFDSDVG
jgi:adenine specific DNA methylase Mod